MADKISMAWIRKTYNVPAKRGARVTFKGKPGHADKVGTITSQCRGDLRIRFDGDKKTYPAFFNPVLYITYH